jgi:hypothetical protein
MVILDHRSAFGLKLCRELRLLAQIASARTERASILLSASALFIALVVSPASVAQQTSFPSTGIIAPASWYFDDISDFSVDSEGNVYVLDPGRLDLVDIARVTKLNTDGQFVTSWSIPHAIVGVDGRVVGINAKADDAVYVLGYDLSSSGVTILRYSRDGALQSKENFEPFIGLTYFSTEDGESGFYTVTNDNIMARMLWDPESSRHVVDDQISVPFTIDNLFAHRSGRIYAIEDWNLWVFSLEGNWELLEDELYDDYFSLWVDREEKVYTLSRYGIELVYGGPYSQFSLPTEPWLYGQMEGDNRGYFYFTVTGDSQYIGVQDFITKVTLDGELVANWSSRGEAPGQLYGPRGVAVGSVGQIISDERVIYVGDAGTGSVKLFDSKGSFIDPNGSFQNPWTGFWLAGDAHLGIDGGITDVVVNNEGGSDYVYVVDLRIQKFDAVGNKVASFSDPDSQWVGTTTLAVSPDGERVYAASYFNRSSIEIFERPDGEQDYELVETWSSTSTGAPEFFGGFNAITVGPSGNVFASYRDSQDVETGGAKLSEFTPEGVPVKVWQLPGPDDSLLVSRGYDAILDLEFDSNGVLYAGRHRYELAGDPQDPQYELTESFGLGLGETPNSFSPDIGEMIVDGLDWVDDATRGLALVESANEPNLILRVDGGNHRVQGFRDQMISDNAKAIILAAGGPFYGNNQWDHTQLCANRAYKALRHRGYTKGQIRYLTAVADELDFDGNGLADDAAGECTIEELEAAFAWASEDVLKPDGSMSPAEELVVFIVDHGENKEILLNPGQTLTADALEDLCDTFAGDLTVILDACEAGGIVDEMKQSARQNWTLIASAAADQNASLLAGGALSFSYSFWTSVMAGNSVQEAYDQAVLDVARKNADGENAQDPVIHDPTPLAGKTFIANKILPPADIPVIGDTTTTYIPPNSILLTAQVTDLDAPPGTPADGIQRVFAVVEPPEFDPLDSDTTFLGLPEIEFEMPESGFTWIGESDQFTTVGDYTISIFAIDADGNISRPVELVEHVGTPFRRQAILVGSWEDGNAVAVQNNLKLAFDALKQQGYDTMGANGPNDVRLLATGPVPGVQLQPLSASLGQLRTSLQQGLGDVGDLAVYLVGNGKEDGYLLDGNDVLTPSELKGILDNLQNSKSSVSGTVTVVMDFDEAGFFAQQLYPPNGKERILLSSTLGSKATFVDGGRLSYSREFWSGVLVGQSTGTAHYQAARTMNALGLGGVPQINDDGSVVGNEPSDGPLALDHRLGLGITLAGGQPITGGVPGKIRLDGGASVPFIVDGVTSLGGEIVRVYSTVVPPQQRPTPAGIPDDIPEITLVQDPVDTDTYSAEITGVTRYGKYHVVTVAVENDDGVEKSSQPRFTTIRQAGAPGQQDDFEEDDSYLTAKTVGVDAPPQTHNFVSDDTSPDEDWVVFYTDGNPEFPITIETTDLGPGADTELFVYTAAAVLDENFDPNSDYFLQNDDAAGTNCEFRDSRIEYAFNTPGFYYVRVRNSTKCPNISNPANQDSYYDLRIYHEDGGFCVVQGEFDVRAVDGANVINTEVTYRLEGPSAHPIVVSKTLVNGAIATFGNLLDGVNYNLTVAAMGYQPEEIQVLGECGTLVDETNLPLIAKTGKLEVTITAVDFGNNETNLRPNMQWRFVGEGSNDWKDSNPGSPVLVKVGTYDIEYRSVTGWNKPLNDTNVIIDENKARSIGGAYTQKPPGSLTVTLEGRDIGNQVVSAPDGAQWRVVGHGGMDNWYASGHTETLPEIAGGYTVVFDPVLNWGTPPSLTNVMITSGQNSVETGVYTQGSGSITVNLSPATAQWRLSGGPWRAHGYTETSLAVGQTYTIEFRSVEGYTTPSDTQVILTAANPNESISIVYQEQTGGCGGSKALLVSKLSMHEEVLPYDHGAVASAVIAPLQPIAVRVRSDIDVAPDSVWIQVQGDMGYSDEDFAWRPVTSDNYQDGWIVFEPLEPYGNGEQLSVSAGATRVDGTNFGPITYEFTVAAQSVPDSVEPYITKVVDDFPVNKLVVESNVTTYEIGPGLFGDPVTVRLPVPNGYRAEALNIMYYSESERHTGWYYAVDVSGFLVPGSRRTVSFDGMTYVEFQVNHGGVVQLATASQIQLGTLSPVLVVLLVWIIVYAAQNRRRSLRIRGDS